jgi:hypothetical protein
LSFFPEYSSFDARPRAGSFRLRRISSYSHGAASAQEYRLRLKRLPPIRQADGSLHLNPRPLRALAPPPLCAVLNVNSRFRFGKKNCASAHLSLQNGIQKIPGEKGRTKANGPTETVTAIQLNN